MNRYFQMSCHALTASAFIALALTGRLDFVSIVVFIIGLAASFHRTLRRLPPLVNARAAFYFSCVYILFFLFDMVVISGSFIPATVHLVLFLELVKFFQEKNDKDYVYLIILAFLKILAASSLTIDMTFVLTLLLFLISLVSTLMSFDMYRSERKAASGAEPEGNPVSGYLGGMSVWATVWIVVLGTGLFFIIPRVGTEYFTRAATSPLLLSGFSEQVKLGQIGQVKLGTAVVMHAKRIAGSAAMVVKWRGIALDRFDGENWSKTNLKKERVPTAIDGSPDVPLDPKATVSYAVGRAQGTGDMARYQILLEPIQNAALFGPYQIQEISGRRRNMQIIDKDGDDSVYMRSTGVRLQYEVLSEVPRLPRAPAVGTAETFPSAIQPRYFQLPEDLDPRVRDLALEITRGATSALDKAARVEAYLKQNYTYSLQLDWDPGRQPVSTFLLSAKRGHCEYFASSMAILLRASGVPTRLVNGFLMGEYNAIGDHFLVREADAHSWVEVYLPNAGWREFDPTPPDPNRTQLTLINRVSQYVDAMEMFWNSYILIYDTGAQMQLFRSAQERAQGFQANFRERSDRWIERVQGLSVWLNRAVRQAVESIAFWGLVVLGVLALLLYPRRQQWMTLLRMRRLRTGGEPDGDLVEQMFYRAASLARGNAPGRAPAQTWREWIEGLPDPDHRRRLERVTPVFERAKYGRETPSREDFLLLETTIRTWDRGRHARGSGLSSSPS